jgi:hypothetical protein
MPVVSEAKLPALVESYTPDRGLSYRERVLEVPSDWGWDRFDIFAGDDAGLGVGIGDEFADTTVYFALEAPPLANGECGEGSDAERCSPPGGETRHWSYLDAYDYQSRRVSGLVCWCSRSITMVVSAYVSQ